MVPEVELTMVELPSRKMALRHQRVAQEDYRHVQQGHQERCPNFPGPQPDCTAEPSLQIEQSQLPTWKGPLLNPG